MENKIKTWCIQQYGDVKGNLKWTVILAAILWFSNAMKKLLEYLTHIPSSIIWIIVFFITLLLLIIINRKDKILNPIDSSQKQESIIDPNKLQSADEFYKTYDNILLKECEEMVRTQTNKYKPGDDREKYLVRLFSSTVINCYFEILWVYIYRSQLSALTAINSRSLKIDDLQPFYEEAKQKYPETYKTYSFISWISFMRSELLFLEQGGTIQITIRGREFLKWMASTGKYIEQKHN